MLIAYHTAIDMIVFWMVSLGSEITKLLEMFKHIVEYNTVHQVVEFLITTSIDNYRGLQTTGNNNNNQQTWRFTAFRKIMLIHSIDFIKILFEENIINNNLSFEEFTHYWITELLPSLLQFFEKMRIVM